MDRIQPPDNSLLTRLADGNAAVHSLAILLFGYPAQAYGQGKKQRESLAEAAHRGRFGQSHCAEEYLVLR